MVGLRPQNYKKIESENYHKYERNSYRNNKRKGGLGG